MRIIYEKNNPVEKAAAEFAKMTSECKDAPRLFMFSGGSALEIARCLPENFFTEGDTVTVLDERYTQNEANSNFANLIKLLGNRILVIDTRPKKGESLKEVADRFEQELKLWKENNPDGKIIITQGVGEDGHTAGILPFPEDKEKFSELFRNSDKWVIGYRVPVEKNKHAERITVTINFLLNQVAVSLLYVRGENKKEILAKMLSDKADLAETPAAAVLGMKEVLLVTDIK
ncbi:MAG: 6-phosphogluconolactonase [bacterium]|nr:6-phosphogluconolactonase [bacterium]